MFRSVGSKVAWVGRTASMVFGLALVLALLFGVASVALAGTGVGAVFNLGVKNTVNAVTELVSTSGAGPNGPMLRIDNNSTGTAATGLEILTEAGKPPMKVNRANKVTNLNADKLDNRDSSVFAARSQFEATQVIKDDGALPLSGTFTSHGGMLLVTATGSGFRSSTNAQFQGNIGMWVYVTDSSGSGPGKRMGVYTNEQNSHKTFVSEPWLINDLPAGTYTVTLEAADEVSCFSGFETDETYCTTTDQNDPFYVTVVELPK